jgi:hypothetical protein
MFDTDSEELKELVGTGSWNEVINLWDLRLNSKEGTSYELRKVSKAVSGKKNLKVSDLRLGSDYVRGIVPDKDIPTNDKEFLIYHFLVSGAYSFNVIRVGICRDVIEDNGSYIFSGDAPGEKYVLTPCENIYN